MVGDGAAEDDEDVLGFVLAEQRDDAGDDDVVRAGEDAEADAVHVLLNGGVDDHLGGLAEAGVDDLHASVAEGAGDDLGAAVVAVEAGLGDQDADWWCDRHRGLSIAGGALGWHLACSVRRVVAGAGGDDSAASGAVEFDAVKCAVAFELLRFVDEAILAAGYSRR